MNDDNNDGGLELWQTLGQFEQWWKAIEADPEYIKSEEKELKDDRRNRDSQRRY